MKKTTKKKRKKNVKSIYCLCDTPIPLFRKPPLHKNLISWEFTHTRSYTEGSRYNGISKNGHSWISSYILNAYVSIRHTSLLIFGTLRCFIFCTPHLLIFGTRHCWYSVHLTCWYSAHFTVDILHTSLVDIRHTSLLLIFIYWRYESILPQLITLCVSWIICFVKYSCSRT
jgi:hypothetical protein